MCTGKNVSCNERNKNNFYVVGSGANPVYVCKRREVSELFTKEFFVIFDLWKNIHYGFGAPHGWDTDPDIKEIIINLENYFEKNFSKQSELVEYIKIFLKVQANARSSTGRTTRKNKRR